MSAYDDFEPNHLDNRLPEKKYKEGTTLDEIIFDGWSRGFIVEQTLSEAVLQGFEVTREEVIKAWHKHDEEMDKFFQSHKESMLEADESFDYRDDVDSEPIDQGGC